MIEDLLPAEHLLAAAVAVRVQHVDLHVLDVRGVALPGPVVRQVATPYIHPVPSDLGKSQAWSQLPSP